MRVPAPSLPPFLMMGWGIVAKSPPLASYLLGEGNLCGSPPPRFLPARGGESGQIPALASSLLEGESEWVPAPLLPLYPRGESGQIPALSLPPFLMGGGGGSGQIPAPSLPPCWGRGNLCRFPPPRSSLLGEGESERVPPPPCFLPTREGNLGKSPTSRFLLLKGGIWDNTRPLASFC